MINLSHRRRAIYTGLKPFLSPVELMEAMKRWEIEYSNKPTYAVNVFIARCCVTPELKARRSEMIRSVIHAMEMDERLLLPDPGSQISVTDFEKINRRDKEVSSSVDIQTRMFSLLVDRYFALLGREMSKAIRAKVATRIFEVDTQERRISAMQDWLVSKTAQLDTSFYIDFLQQVFNLIYVESCDAVGPVKADSSLAMALRTVEPIAAESSFNLRQLL